MLIRKKVRSLDAYLGRFASKERFYVAVSGLECRHTELAKVGFSVPLVVGEQLLPSSEFGIASRRNADGKEVIHDDRPKEIHYLLREWTWHEFHGRHERVERSKIVEVPYERYPRSWKEPHGVELLVRQTPAGAPIVTAGPYRKDSVDIELLINTVHLFVEIFGECQLMSQGLRESMQPRLRRLNWDVLPPGKYPWTRAQTAVERVFQSVPEGSQAVLRARSEAITAFAPDFIAVGRNGFSRYVVYGWDERELYVLESTEVNNATYVLRRNWEAVSAMTKAEVLAADAHHARLVHRESWWKNMEELMRTEGIRSVVQVRKRK